MAAAAAQLLNYYDSTILTAARHGDYFF